jgi:hypothetical protein
MRKTLLVLVLALCSACTARPVAPPDDGHPTPDVPSNTTQDSGAHGADTAECGVSGLVLACASCTERDLDYDTADQVTPEMNEVWSWFANEPSLVAYSPARYCAF